MNSSGPNGEMFRGRDLLLHFALVTVGTMSLTEVGRRVGLRAAAVH